jgi:hypothetical protein
VNGEDANHIAFHHFEGKSAGLKKGSDNVGKQACQLNQSGRKVGPFAPRGFLAWMSPYHPLLMKEGSRKGVVGVTSGGDPCDIKRSEELPRLACSQASFLLS